jgi:phosphohistidine phosphatase
MDKEEFLLHRKDDSLRPLVPKGREKTKALGSALRHWGLKFDLIVTSPLTRAQQTAEILADSLKITNIFESEELRPQAPPMAFAQWLKLHAEDCLQVLTVGHEPQLSLFASWCLTGQKESFLDLKKSGLIGLKLKSFTEIKPGNTQLEYMLAPKYL